MRLKPGPMMVVHPARPRVKLVMSVAGVWTNSAYSKKWDKNTRKLVLIFFILSGGNHFVLYWFNCKPFLGPVQKWHHHLMVVVEDSRPKDDVGTTEILRFYLIYKTLIKKIGRRTFFVRRHFCFGFFFDCVHEKLTKMLTLYFV